MSMLDIPTLERWIDRFYQCKLNFARYGLVSAFQLIFTRIHPGFMAHMQTRWNPITRTFHLGDRQMCPTVEEFRAILMITEGPMLRLKPHANSISFKNVLQKEFGITKTKTELLIHRNKLHLQRLSDLLALNDNSPHTTEIIMTTVTMILAHFFLSPEDDRPSVKVLEVAHTLRQTSMDITGLILAETIMGLNQAVSTSNTLKRGSPLTLYIWLLDKLQYMPVPKCPIHLEIQLDRLEQVKPNDKVSDDSSINDLMPWYSIVKMVGSMNGKPMITLFGLEYTTFYFTTHLHRQFGQDIMPIMSRDDIMVDMPITYKSYIAYEAQWINAIRMDIPKKYTNYLDAILHEASTKRKTSNQDARLSTKRFKRRN